MTIRDATDSNIGDTNEHHHYVVPSAPTESTLYNNTTSYLPEMIVHAQPVYPGAHNGDNIPLVQAVSVDSEQDPHTSGSNSNNPHGSVMTGMSGSTSTTSGPIALATGPARPTSSFAIVTGPARPPQPVSSSVTPGVSVVTGPQGTNSNQPVHLTAQYNSRYRNSNGALTCCAVSTIVCISICVCCFLPAFVFVIAWGAAGANWQEFDQGN
jgi:hypothetical protein